MRGGNALTRDDAKRIKTLRDRVLELMEDSSWRTLREIVDAVGGSEAGVSARLRDLRKFPFNRTVERRRRGTIAAAVLGVERGGLHEYRLIPIGQLGLFANTGEDGA